MQENSKEYVSRFHYAINEANKTIEGIKEMYPRYARFVSYIHYIQWPAFVVGGLMASYTFLDHTEKGTYVKIE